MAEELWNTASEKSRKKCFSNVMQGERDVGVKRKHSGLFSSSVGVGGVSLVLLN